MIDKAKELAYKVFGLIVFSEIHFPELPQLIENEDSIDVVVKKADLAKLWCELVPPEKKYVVIEDLFMFKVPNIATFCIRKGKEIIVSPIKGADKDQIRLFILGTCMGALLMQRKVLPLHGSALAINGKAYCVIGDSGAGKSTLASAFLNGGYQLLSDDVIAVSFADDNTPYVTPSYPQQKLWQESLKEFGLETGGYSPIFQRETKYMVPVLSKFSNEQLPLGGVFELMKTVGDRIEIRRIERLQAVQTLFLHTYRNFLIPKSGLMEWHFRTSVNILNHIDMYQLRRPCSGFTAHQLVSLVLHSLKKEA